MHRGYAAIAVVILLAIPHAASQQAESPPTTPPDAAAPATPPPATPGPEGPIQPPPSVIIIDATDARGILGRDVRTTADENMGRIVDVVVDRAGQVRAAVIDFGGFLGVGSRKIVVDWKALRFTRVANKGDNIILELTREQVRAAPEYKEGRLIVVLGASGVLEPLRFIPTTPEN
jgi:hypothetical protein